MTEPVRQPDASPPETGYGRVPRLVGITALLLIALLAAGYYLYFPSQLGPEQPISFSHRVHATDKQISCVFCHPDSINGERSGVPPVQTCMLCHSRIISTHPQIQQLWGYYQRREPVPWVRVNDLPDYVFFNHQIHTRRGYDCSRCHGDIAGMDRVRMVTWKEVGASEKGADPVKMGFCIQCHRDNGGSHDCFTCHR